MNSRARHIVLWTIASTIVVAADALAPEQIVRETTAEVIGRIRGDRATLAADPRNVQAMVRELILPHVDFDGMSRLVMAERWRELSAGEQACLTSGLRNRFTERYAGILLLYDDQAVSYAAAPAPAGQAAIVQTITLAHGPAAVITYRMQGQETGWRVVDLTVDGVSLVENYREQYRYEIGRVGLGDFLRTFPECRER